ncbi:hypothetical protein B0T11DRAFT_102195 [Plectosphaerella cucumerina]|uniref:Uncharacterized protein n=1 Tax=Plectosphaerella cucumerina TaxID=40658 RepID=A0A8K0TC86_9PEZI|nr:hypothetical protein B0T11DRAFT_102195 [Plectosphaerella cucumerina]
MTATMEARHHFQQSHIDSLTAEDFETASIRSAAPSYISEAPSYHSTAPYGESTPPYTPPGTTTTSHSTNTTQPYGTPSPSTSLLPDNPRVQHRTIGLPPIPPRGSTTPSLNNFIIPSWSVVNSNPTYQNVARRRAQSDHSDPVASMRRAFLLERVAEDEDSPPASSSVSRDRTPEPSSSSGARRHLEDPHLVGEEAAAQARRRRLARERGNDILVQEDRQWNWFLAQMGTWEERDRSWTRFRQEIDSGQRRKLSRRLAGRLF